MNNLKVDTKKASSSLKEDSEIPEITNPFEGEKAQGWDAALTALAAGLFDNTPENGKSSPSKPDPRLEPLPIPNKPSDSDDSDDSDSSDDTDNSNDTNDKDTDSAENQKDQDSSSQKNKEKPDDKDSKSNNSLSQNEVDDLIDRIKQLRDAAEDVVDDAGDPIQRNAAEQTADKLGELEKEVKKSKTEVDANKVQARLKSIADFWDDPKNTTSLKNDTKARNFDKQLNRELRQARLNARKRNYDYTPLRIDQIVNNIVRTIKNETRDVRDSDWSRYNDRARDLGYIAPGRYTDQKKIKPSVVFYFDISGSWCSDKIKIDMGHRIEEALKKLDKEEKIALSCFYFGTKVHDHFTKQDQGNSDAPIPHAIELLNAGKLDNVIIMTDDNPRSNEKLQVPGFAWLLFYDTVSESLAANVSGKKGTKIVMIDHS